MSGHADVTGEVDARRVSAMNARPDTPVSNLFVPDAKLVVRSDADSQLLLAIPFNQTVKLSAIIIDAPAEQRPTVAKLYVNRPALGFDELDDIEPTQKLALRAEDVAGGREVKLKFVSFTRVNSLHVFLDAEGGDVVAVSSLRFVGAPVAGTDMSKLKKVGEEEGE